VIAIFAFAQRVVPWLEHTVHTTHVVAERLPLAAVSISFAVPPVDSGRANRIRGQRLR